MEANRPISEDDLHAYVDQALDAARHAEVEDYLAQHADVAGRVESYGIQRQALREALQPIAEEPIPSELNLSHFAKPVRPFRISAGQSMAAAMALLIVGGAVGWSLRGGMASQDRAGIVALAEEAADSFKAYGADHTHAVELSAAQSTELVGWVSNSLRRPVAIPDLSQTGYRFMGGRVVPTAHGPAAIFMYDDDHGTRLTMLVRPMRLDHDMPMSQHEMGPVNGYAWAQRGLGYSLVGGAAVEKLHPLADEVRRQVVQVHDDNL